MVTCFYGKVNTNLYTNSGERHKPTRMGVETIALFAENANLQKL